MNELERILMECRYVISLNKNYNELAKVFKVSSETIYDDLNNKLMQYDTSLFQRVQKILKNINNY